MLLIQQQLFSQQSWLTVTGRPAGNRKIKQAGTIAHSVTGLYFQESVTAVRQGALPAAPTKKELTTSAHNPQQTDRVPRHNQPRCWNCSNITRTLSPQHLL
jgi:hypothetical protein